MTGRAIAVITAGFFTVSIAYAIRYGYGIFLPEMIPALAISKTEAGVIASSYFVAYTLFSPLLGLLSDRYDMRIILSSFTALLSAGALCMAFAESVLSASFFFALAGIGHSACWVPVVALVQRSVPDNRRGMALSFTTMGAGIGIAAWSMLLPFIINRYSWQSGWIALGVAGFCVAALNFMLIRSHPQKVTGETAIYPSVMRLNRLWGVYRALLKEKNLWLIGLSYLLVGFTVLVPYTFLTVYALEELEIPYSLAGRLLAVMAVSGMVGKMILGILSDTLGRVRVMIACGMLLAAGCLGIGIFQDLRAIFLSTVLFGIGWGAVWPVYAAAAPDFFTNTWSGSVIGIWTVFLGVGSIVSPVLCGWSIDATGSYMVTFFLGFIGGISSSLLLLPILRAPKVDAVISLQK
jgi:MFS family permease